MRNTSPAVEIRFWIPLHLEEAARKAISPFVIEECQEEVPTCGSPCKPEDSMVTAQEITVLLKG
jgi:hypothetical protein